MLLQVDHSSNHGVYPPNALLAKEMNLNDGGKNKKPMRDGWYLDAHGNRVVQKMMLQDCTTLRGFQTFVVSDCHVADDSTHRHKICFEGAGAMGQGV